MRRKSRNQSYSLRAFARDLQMSPSSLSAILRGNQSLRENTAESIAQKLNFKFKEKAFLKDLILAESARNEKVREFARQRLKTARKTQRYKPLKEDQFRVIADWYHGAIVELVTVRGFDPSPQWIASRLGIDIEEAKASLFLLEKLGLIKKAGGTYVTNPYAYDAIIERPSAAVRKFQRQVIAMSIASLFEDPGEEREVLSMIVAIPRAQLPEFRQEMRKFVSDFWQRIENVPKDDLYSFSQLCPVKNRRKRPSIV